MKKKQEEIIKTHVLNLNEIRESERNDNKKINKRRIIIASILGIILITTGLLYPTIINKLKTTKQTTEKKKIKDVLSCTANFENKTYNINVLVKQTYNFNSNKLTSSTITTTFSPSNDTPTESLNALYEKYNLLYSENKTEGIIYKISYSQNELIVTERINDYNKIDLKTYDQTLNTDNQTMLYSPKNSYEEIKKQSEQLGSLCN